jgi:hypothetical protein
MLLAQKTDPIQHLPHPCRRALEAFAEPGILLLEFGESLTGRRIGADSGLERARPALGVERAPAECGEFVAEFPYERL